MQQHLFEDTSSPPVSIIPQDGVAFYHRYFLSQDQANRFFDKLIQTIEWQHDELYLFGKKINTKRKVAFYGDRPFAYSYSKSVKTALPWTDELIELKKCIEAKTGETYNSCLINLYHSGAEGMSWHCDNEKELLKHGSIASLSLGAERKFMFKHKRSKETVSLLLLNGSLLDMKGEIQEYWLHQLPLSSKILQPRINLTFRTIIEKVQ